uniref:DUF7041 domain-containing protein n=1 Tax=Heliothis virescens TaxID=7102 RepID=A0A2A4JUK3_HELVI
MTTGVPPTAFTPAADVMAISLSSRIPEFWDDQPRVWFMRVEATLSPQKLGDEARFELVVSKLPKEVIGKITDFLSKPPETGKFSALKTKLLTLFEDTRTRQIEKLIGEMELGDQKPSHLLCRMRDLARDKIPDDTLRVMWQAHLPPAVRAVLVVSETKDLDNLAVIADNVAEVTSPAQVSEVQREFKAQTQRTEDLNIATLTAELAKINARLTNIERSRSRTRRDVGVNRRFSRSNSRRRTPSSSNWLCDYHYRFRHRAQRCVPPCAWKTRNGQKNAENTGSEN